MELIAEKINKSYGRNHALCDFSHSFTPGIYALLGPNGSGKTTLMNIITDNLSMDSGSLTLDGKNVFKMGADYRRLLGYMPQFPGIYPDFSGREYLFYVAALKELKKPADQIDCILKITDLSDSADKRTRTYSGGMLRRLALAQAVIGDPSILILDEPTAGLDPGQRIAFKKYISRLASDRIVIISTHVVSDVESVSKEALFLKKGVVVESGHYDNLENEYMRIFPVGETPGGLTID